MATTINIREAKTHLSRIVDEVAAGKEFIIAKAGRPMAKLIPLAGASKAKQLGLLRGRVTVPDDFDAPLPEYVLRDFDGG